MATREYNNPVNTLEFGVVKLYAKVTFGAVGAPTLTTGKGIQSITRTATGSFTIAYGDAQNTSTRDKYPALLAFNEVKIDDSLVSGSAMQLHADSGSTGYAYLRNYSVGDVDQSLIDPDSGAVSLCEFTLSNSSAK